MIKKISKLIVLLAALNLPAAPGRAGEASEVIPVLQVGYQTFTNALILNVTACHLFFQTDHGMQAVKLADLDQALQKKFDYDPAQAVVIPEVDSSFAPVASGKPAGPAAGRPDGVRRTNNQVQLPHGTGIKDYPMRNAGVLSLVVPDLWNDDVQTTPADLPPSLTIRFRRMFSEDLVVLITSIPEGSTLLKNGLRGTMESLGNRALAQAVETKLDLKELQGDETSGCYFSITDKKLAEVWSPKPGTYKHQTQGLVTIGNFALSFTILCNNPGTRDFESALEMMKTVHFTKADQDAKQTVALAADPY